MTTNEANQLFLCASSRILSAYWEFYPNVASRLGLNDYDGRISDISKESINKRIIALNEFLSDLDRIDSFALSVQAYFEYRTLECSVKTELFELSKLKIQESNPMEMLTHIDLSHYLKRPVTTKSHPIEALLEALQKIPKFLSQLEDSLSNDLHETIIEATIESYEGISDFWDVELREEIRRVGSILEYEHFNEVIREARKSISLFVSFLRNSSDDTDRSFSIGRTQFSEYLKVSEMLDISIETLLEIGIADLTKNLHTFRLVAEKMHPTFRGDPKHLIKIIKQNHPSESDLIAYTRNLISEIREYVRDKNLVSIPTESICEIAETPKYLRWAFAVLDTPGPFEASGAPSFFYITPPSPDWTEKEKEEWLTTFNYSSLRSIAAHESFPGHYLHHLHSTNLESTIGSIFKSYAHSEGWAHYAEEIIMEGEYAENNVCSHLAQIQEALIRNCRYICSIKMHTQGMTVAEATAFFVENAYLENLPASKEAIRGTFDPMYLNYTLGKLLIQKFRNDYKLVKGEHYTDKLFHDKILSYGAPPIPLLRELILRHSEGNVL